MCGSRRRRSRAAAAFLAAALVHVAVAAAPSQASGQPSELQGFELEELVLESDAIVLAEPLKTPKAGQSHRVSRAYRGGCFEGQEIELVGPESMGLVLAFLDEGRGHEVVQVAAAAFEPRLLAAIARVEALHATPRGASLMTRERLLRILGPPLPRPVFAREHRFAQARGVDDAVLGDLFLHHGLGEALAAMSRIRATGGPFDVVDPLDVELLLRTSMDRSLPDSWRSTALLILAAPWWGANEEKLAAGLPALLKDPEPEVRKTAAVNLADFIGSRGESPFHPAVVKDFLEALNAERDPPVRLVHLELAGGLGLLDRLERPDRESPFLVEALVRGTTVFYACAARSGSAPPRAAHAASVLAAPAGGGEERRSAPLGWRGFWKEGAVATARARLHFDPPLAPGGYRVRLEARIAAAPEGPVAVASSPAFELTVAP